MSREDSVATWGGGDGEKNRVCVVLLEFEKVIFMLKLLTLFRGLVMYVKRRKKNSTNLLPNDEIGIENRKLDSVLLSNE